MAIPFSSSDVDVIERKLQVVPQITASKNELEEMYEISRCVHWIEEHNFKNTTLQFPDEMLGDSAAVAVSIGRKTKTKVYILGDTSYGSCCVDEVAAEHIRADSIIHFGHSCLSPTRRLPLLYIFGKQIVDIDSAAKYFRQFFSDPESAVVILYDVMYSHAADSLYQLLANEYSRIVLSTLNEEVLNNFETISKTKMDCVNACGDCSCRKTSSKMSSVVKSDLDESANIWTGDAVNKGTIYKFGRIITLPENAKVDDYAMFFIGPEGSCLLNFMLTFNKCPFYTYNPKTSIGRQELLSVNRTLMKRYYLIEKARDASLVGILVGTLGVASYLSIIKRLKEVVKNAGKKPYVLAMGKINAAKLANFPEIDIFVLVACPENSMIDSKEFFQPIVTPYELEIACNNARSWTGDYVTDFRELLPGASEYVELSDKPSDETDVSLISGRVRSTKIEDVDIVSNEQALLPRNDVLTVAPVHRNAAGELFDLRSWTGLEQHLGETPVTMATEGRSGRASTYQNEAELFTDDKKITE